MADLGGFNANQVEPSSGDFEALSPGKYEVMVTATEKVENSNGSGQHLKLTFTVVRGEFEGKPIWHRLNLWHQNGGKVVQIAQGQLSAICHAVGILTPRDSTDLHNLPLLVTVKQETYDEGKISNKITSFAPRDGAAPVVTAPQAPAAPSSAPWKK